MATGLPRVLVVHPATQHSYQTALGLQAKGMLDLYFTGYYHKRTGVLATLPRLLPGGPGRRVRRELERRRHERLDEKLIDSLGLGEILAVAATRLSWRLQLSIPRIQPWRDRRFESRVSQLLTERRPDAVLCYDTTALGIFQAAKRLGIACILDQTICHPRMLREVLERFDIYSDVTDELIERIDAEVTAADLVLAGSEYVRSGAIGAGAPPDRVSVVPYGVDIARFSPVREASHGKVRILYVGRVSYRKGIQHLVDALRLLDREDVELVIVGAVWGDIELVRRSYPRLEYHSHLPNAEIARLYRSADVYCLPSLHEGSSYTVYEALASGLPVVTTPNTGTVVREGEEGFIVPVGDVAAIADRLSRLIDDPALRAAMGANARRRAEEFSWDRYHRQVARVIGEALA